MRYVALLGEFTPTFKPHVATNAAIKHTCAALDLGVEGEWVSTQDIGHSLFSRYSGIWVAPGSPYKNLERTLWAIEHARTNNIPCFGTCGGFQHMVLEYARNVLHFSDAQHAEYDPYASTLFITQLACSLAEATPQRRRSRSLKRSRPGKPEAYRIVLQQSCETIRRGILLIEPLLINLCRQVLTSRRDITSSGLDY